MFCEMSFWKRCPYCHCLVARRTARKSWMRIIPWSRRYRCDECDTLYWVIVPGQAESEANHHANHSPLSTS